MQLLGHGHGAHFHGPDEVAGVSGLFLEEEGVGVALVAGPASPPTPVHVVLVVVGHIVVNHQHQLLHIQPPGGN